MSEKGWEKFNELYPDARRPFENEAYWLLRTGQIYEAEYKTILSASKNPSDVSQTSFHFCFDSYIRHEWKLNYKTSYLGKLWFECALSVIFNKEIPA